MASSTHSTRNPQRARLALAARVLLLLSLPLPAGAHAVTHQVDQDDPACDDSSGTPFCTVQGAVWGSLPDDVVEVGPGVYIEEVTIDRSLTLRGAGASTVEGACDGATELLGAPPVTVAVGSTVTLSGVTILGIADEGGGIHNAGTLTLSNAEVCRSAAFQRGAGIYTTGALELVDVAVYDNEQGSPGGEGGGLYVAAGGSATVFRSTFSGNRAARGGGIAVEPGGTLLISLSTLKANYADDTAVSATPAWGGGLYNAGLAVVDRTSVGALAAGNVALPGGRGGGIYNDGALLVTRSTLVSNAVDGDPGAFVYGAGLYNAGVASLVSSTVSANGFAVEVVGYGAGIATAGTLSLSNVTITGNYNSGAAVVSGAGLHVDGGTASLRNSIVAEQAVGTDCSGSITTDGYNLDSDGTCDLIAAASGGTDLPAVADAGLLPLSSKGGPTRTHPLAEDSPAIDAGNPAGCLADLDGDGVALVALAADQRGTSFVDVPGLGAGAGACDVGAHELDLVANGMMEDDVDRNGLPDGWTAAKLTAGDRLVCDAALVHAGRCAFRLTGAVGVGKRLSQVLERAGSAGDDYVLRVHASGDALTGNPRLRVQLDDLQTLGVEQEVSLPLGKGGTFPYGRHTLRLAAAGDHDRITLILEPGSGGTLHVDDVSLVPSP
jgi:hypothetical protein